MTIDLEKLPKTWSAGQELDGLVALEIMGVKRERGIWINWSISPHWEVYRPEIHRQYLTWGEDNLPVVYVCENEIAPWPPRYSSDISRAFQVVHRMRKDGFSFKAWQHSLAAEGDPLTNDTVVSFVCSTGPCRRHGTDFHNHHGAYDVQAETLPLGICKAAFIALCKAKAVE